MRSSYFTTFFATVYLVIYCVMLQFESLQYYAVCMFFFSPVVVGLMIFTVIRYGKYNGPELDDREFGYQDKEIV
ncbi:MAG: hypothetical protein JST75_21745 [Bacteroidetes bacterium]|nr:hypothetical protein [Bacteroidota bacterium]